MDKRVDRLPAKETLTVEFKSDRSGFPNNDLIEALVCLANAEGGELWLGVEDDGTPSGLHTTHQNILDLPRLVAASTSPALRVSVSKQLFSNVEVARIDVPKAQTKIATTSGAAPTRRLKSDSTPECVSFLPEQDNQ